VSKIVVDTIESTGATVTVNDALTTGTNAITAGSVTGITAASITSGTLGAGASVTNASLPAGSVVQVVSATTTSPASFSSSTTNTFVDLSGLTVSITPTSASSKILVFFTVNVTRSSSATQHVRLMRDTTAIAIGDQAGSNRLRDTVVTRDSPSGGVPYEYWIGNLNGSNLDSPSTTSATVYKLQGTLGASYSGTFYINQCNTDGDNDYSGRPVSTITVMEIKA
jgi:hypothetical protein